MIGLGLVVKIANLSLLISSEYHFKKRGHVQYRVSLWGDRLAFMVAAEFFCFVLLGGSIGSQSKVEL